MLIIDQMALEAKERIPLEQTFTRHVFMISQR